MFLLDTHTFIWLCMNRELLPSKILQLMDDESDGLFISSITATEIGLLVNKGKVSIPRSREEFLHENLSFLALRIFLW